MKIKNGFITLFLLLSVLLAKAQVESCGYRLELELEFYGYIFEGRKCKGGDLAHCKPFVTFRAVDQNNQLKFASEILNDLDFYESSYIIETSEDPSTWLWGFYTSNLSSWKLMSTGTYRIDFKNLTPAGTFNRDLVHIKYTPPVFRTPKLVDSNDPNASLGNICKDKFRVSVGSWFTPKNYKWMVRRTDNPVTGLLNLATTSSNEIEITPSMLSNVFGTRDNWAGKNLQLEVWPDGGTVDCVRDSKSAPALMVVHSPPPSLADITTATPSCNGSSGAITLSKLRYTPEEPFGGKQQLTYTLTLKPSGPVYNYISADSEITFNDELRDMNKQKNSITSGNWQVDITTSTGNCSSTLPAIKVPDPPLALTSSEPPIITHPSCSGMENGNGTITVHVANGVNSLTYTLYKDNKDLAHQTKDYNSYTFTGLGPGDYTVKVEDHCGSKIIFDGLQLTDPYPIIISKVVTTNAICDADKKTGELEIKVKNGQPNYSFEISGLGFTSRSATNINIASYTFEQLPVGSYTIKVTDAKGCSVISETQSIGTLAPLQLSSEQVDPTCHGAQDGQIILSASGGSENYEYSIDGIKYSNQNVFEKLTGGAYKLIVQDASAPSCLVKKDVTLIDPPAIDPVINLTHVSCHGNATGQISVQIKDADPHSYKYTVVDHDDIKVSIDFFEGKATFKNLAAGNYQVKITDRDNCSITSPAQSITQPEEVELITDLINNIRCFGSSDGVIKLKTKGGVYPHTVNLKGLTDRTQNVNNENSTALFSGLAAGSYSLTVTYNNVCSKNMGIVTLAEPKELHLTLAADKPYDDFNIKCYGEASGKISASVDGGTMPFTYSITHGSAYSEYKNVMDGTFNFTLLTADTYTVAVADSHNCPVKQDTKEIKQPDELKIAAIDLPNNNGFQVNCNGAQTGYAKISTQGGVYPHTVTLVNLNKQQQINSYGQQTTFDGLGAALYTVTVADKFGCSTRNNSFEILQPAKIELDDSKASIKNVDCYGGNSGKITVQAIGGLPNPNYKYTLTNEAHSVNVDLIKPDLAVFENLLSGDYKVQVTDQMAGCVFTSQKIIITQPDDVTFTTQVSDYHGSNVSCAASFDGEIKLSTTGGTFPHTISLPGFPDQVINANQDAVFSGLPAGQYSFTVTYSNLCKKQTDIIKLNAPLELSLNVNPKSFGDGSFNISCHGRDDGAITASGLGGTMPYTYSISPVGVPNQYTSVMIHAVNFEHLTASDYRVSLTDVNGCTKEVHQKIKEPDELKIPKIELDNFNGFQVNCNGAQNGHAAFFTQGGSYPHTVKLNGISQSQQINSAGESTVFNGLGARQYEYEVVDNVGCFSNGTFEILQPAKIELDNAKTSVTNIECFGNSTGKINVQAMGGLPHPDYSYHLIGGPQHVDIPLVKSGLAVFENLFAGDYTIQITDQIQGCVVTSPTLTISQRQEFVLTPVLSNYHGSNVSCPESFDGTVTLTTTDHLYPQTVSLPGFPNQIIDMSHREAFFSGLKAGDYLFTVTYNSGICATKHSIKLEAPEALSLALNPKPYGDGFNISCNSKADGVITVTTVGGIKPYSYFITPRGVPNQYNNTTESTVNFEQLAAGNYTISLTDVNNCTIEARQTLIEPGILKVSKIEMPDFFGHQLACNGDHTALVKIFTQGGSYPQTVSLLNPSQSGQTNSIVNGVEFTGLGAGVYDYQLVDKVGCTYMDNFKLVEPAKLKLDDTKTFIENVDCFGSSTGKINVQATGGLPHPDYSYHLTGGPQHVDIPLVESDLAVFKNLLAGTYTIKFTDEMQNCFATSPAITVTQPDQIMLHPILSNYHGSNVSCSGFSDGFIKLATTGGVYPHNIHVTGWSDQQNNLNDLITFSDFHAGSYLFTTTYKNGLCRKDTVINLVEPPVLTLASRPSLYGDNFNVSCHGATDGVINVEAGGGTKPYMFATAPLGVPNQYSNVTANVVSFEKFKAGEYTISLTDVNHCLIQKQQTLIEPDVLEEAKIEMPDFFGRQLACNGDQNASVKIFTKGGSYPQNISLLNSSQQQNTNSITDGIVFDGLGAGKYEYKVKDEVGCTYTGNFEIKAPDKIKLDDVKTLIKDVDCFGNSTGKITVQAVGGLPDPNYKYTLTNETHSVTIDLVKSGFAVFENLFVGDYTIQITDKMSNADQMPNCIIKSSTIKVKQPDQIMLHPILSNYHGSNVSCSGFSDGVIKLATTGGVYPHNIHVTGWSDQQNNLNDLITFSGFHANSYSFTATYKNGLCRKDTVITLVEPPVLTLVSSPSLYGDNFNISCHDAADGVIKVEGGGGTKPYMFTTAPLGVPNQYSNVTTNVVSFEQFKAGEYTISLTDVNHCLIQKQQTLIEPDVLEEAKIEMPDFFGRQLACNGDQNASVKIFTKGGSYPQTVSLVNSSQMQNTNSTNEGIGFNGLGAGQYSYNVVDKAGCTYAGHFRLVEPAHLQLSDAETLIKKPDCFGDRTGALTLHAQGGIPIGTTKNHGIVADGTAYDYEITYHNLPNNLPFPFPEVQTLSGAQVNFKQLIAGTYGVKIRDMQGCVSDNTLVIETNLQIKSELVTTDVICKSESNGAAQVSVSGGKEPYTIKWLHQQSVLQNTTSVAENQVITLQKLPAGLYEYVVTDGSGCRFYNGNSTFQINAPARPLTLGARVTNVKCKGDGNGIIILAAIGGWQNSPYQYGVDLSNMSINNTIYDGMKPGVYTYFVRDNKGCTGKFDVAITEPNALQSSIAANQMVSCYGLKDGKFTITTTGGTSPYQASIDGGATWKEIDFFDKLGATLYTAQVRDANSCRTSANVTITEPPALVTTVASIQNTWCKKPNGSATINVSGGTSPYTITWLDANNKTLGNGLTQANLLAGNYSVNAIDDHRCTANPLPVKIINGNDIVFTLNDIKDVSCFNNTDGKATVVVSQIVSPYTVTWDNGAHSTTVTNLAAGQHQVTLKDATDCQASQTFNISTPKVLDVAVVKKNPPICFGDCNGTIEVKPSGGTAPYTYQWSGSSNVSSVLSNACAGEYLLVVSDKNNCSYQQRITLTSPKKPDLGIEDTTYHICKGQAVGIDVGLWKSYSWSSNIGFNSFGKTVSLSTSGHYTVNVTNEFDCKASAQFDIVYLAELLKAEFLLPKEAYVSDTVTCVDISEPQQDVVISWNYDHHKIANASLLGPYNKLIFLEEGKYDITIESHFGGCIATQTKSITIMKRDKSNASGRFGYVETGIKALKVFPNPNDGQFACTIMLYKAGYVRMRLLDLNGKVLEEFGKEGVDEVTADFNIQGQPAGVYTLVIEANGDTETFNIIKK